MNGPTPEPRRRVANTERLVLSHFSLARNHPLDDRIRSAGEAGFNAIGLFAGQYRQLVNEGWTTARVNELLAEAGVTIAEVEALSGWGAHRPTSDYMAFEEFAWTMVEDFAVPYVQAIGPVESAFDGTLDDVAVRFGALCDRAAGHGATVGLEFLPFTNITNAADALAIVERAGRPNGGVCVDIWHHVRGANDLDMIRRIPPELIVGVQMSDGPVGPTIADYKDDCLRTRLPPGDGEFDVDTFVTTLLDMGVDLAWDLEVCNEASWGRPAHEYVAGCAAAMRRVLQRCLPTNAPNNAPTDPNHFRERFCPL